MIKKLVVAIFLAIACSSLAIPTNVAYTVVPETPKETKCLAWVVHNESRGESLEGSRAVLDVVLKRMRDSGKEACDVIAERRQFSGYHERAVRNVSEEALRRYDVVSAMKPVGYKCKYFHAKHVRPAWATKMTKCFRIGNHLFFKEKQK